MWHALRVQLESIIITACAINVTGAHSKRNPLMLGAVLHVLLVHILSRVGPFNVLLAQHQYATQHQAVELLLNVTKQIMELCFFLKEIYVVLQKQLADVLQAVFIKIFQTNKAAII